jgi:hypothetical protein
MMSMGTPFIAMAFAAHVGPAWRVFCKRARKIIAEAHERMAEVRLDSSDA